jgi:pimeloyl-ACP methyl ester carboxylesterase
MLADPAGNGVAGGRTFDVVIPSLPGYAFSPAPVAVGTNVFAIADQWVSLMEALGYSRFIPHGGDIGAGVSTALGLRHKDRIVGVHLNYIPGSYQPYLATPSDLSDEEKAFLVTRAAWADPEGGYSITPRERRIFFDGVGRPWTRDGVHSNWRKVCTSVFYVAAEDSNESSRTLCRLS